MKPTKMWACVNPDSLLYMQRAVAMIYENKKAAMYAIGIVGGKVIRVLVTEVKPKRKK